MWLLFILFTVFFEEQNFWFWGSAVCSYMDCAFDVVSRKSLPRKSRKSLWYLENFCFLLGDFYRSLLNDFFVHLYVVGVWILSSVCVWMDINFPSIICQKDCRFFTDLFCIFVKNQLPLYGWVCFCTFHSVSQMHLSTFILIPLFWLL